MEPSTHKKRASSWATLQDLADEAAAEEAATTDVDIKKTTSSPALQQMLSPHPAVSSSGARTSLETGTATSAHANTGVIGDPTASTATTAAGADGGALAGMIGNNPAEMNAFTAATGAMNPLQLASMKLFASMNMNIGVKMGLNMARMGGMRLAEAGNVGPMGGTSAPFGPGIGDGGAGAGMRTSRNPSSVELQDLDEERVTIAPITPPYGAPLTSAAGAGGSTLPSSDDMENAFDTSEFDMYRSGVPGGGGEGMFFEGHPSVEPKEAGSLKRTFKSCPDFSDSHVDPGGAGGSGFLGGISRQGTVATAPPVGSIGMEKGRFSAGAGGVLKSGGGVGGGGSGWRPLAPLAPVATSAEQQSFALGLPPGMMPSTTAGGAIGAGGPVSGPGPAAGVAAGTGLGLNFANNLKLMQQMAAAAAAATATAAAAAAAAAGVSSGGSSNPAHPVREAGAGDEGRESPALWNAVNSPATPSVAKVSAAAAAAAASTNAEHRDKGVRMEIARSVSGDSVGMEWDTAPAGGPSTGMSRLGRAASIAGGVGVRGGRAAAAAAPGVGPSFSSSVRRQANMKPATSCPNIAELGWAGGMDERKSRRLERNRASARVRRQRKKDMVELYEKDVARLERGIATLKMHVWGTGEGVALADALAGGQAEQSGGNGVRGTGGGGDGNVGGVTTSAVLPEKERMAARDQAAASVEEHLQDIALGANDAHAIALAARHSSFPGSQTPPNDRTDSTLSSTATPTVMGESPSVGKGPISTRLGTVEVTVAEVAATAAAVASERDADMSGMSFESWSKARDGGGESLGLGGGLSVGRVGADDASSGGCGGGTVWMREEAAAEALAQAPGGRVSGSGHGRDQHSSSTHVSSPESTDWWEVLDVPADAMPTATAGAATSPTGAGGGVGDGGGGGGGNAAERDGLSPLSIGSAAPGSATTRSGLGGHRPEPIKHAQKMVFAGQALGVVNKEEGNAAAASVEVAGGVPCGDGKAGMPDIDGRGDDKAKALREAVRLDAGQDAKLTSFSGEWENELLIAMVLSKVSSALRTPERMDVAAAQATTSAFEGLTSEEQRSKFYKWIDSNREAIALLDDAAPASPTPSPSERHGLHADATAAAAASGSVPTQRGKPRDIALDTGSGSAFSTGSRRGAGVASCFLTPASARPRHGVGWADAAVSAPGMLRGNASPQFRFQGEDGSGGEDGGEGVAGVGSRGRERVGAMHALAMDQSP